MTVKTRRRFHEYYAHVPLGVWLLLAPFIMTVGDVATGAMLLFGIALILMIGDFLYQEFDGQFFSDLRNHRS